MAKNIVSCSSIWLQLSIHLECGVVSVNMEDKSLRFLICHLKSELTASNIKTCSDCDLLHWLTPRSKRQFDSFAILNVCSAYSIDGELKETNVGYPLALAVNEN